MERSFAQYERKRTQRKRTECLEVVQRGRKPVIKYHINECRCTLQSGSKLASCLTPLPETIRPVLVVILRRSPANACAADVEGHACNEQRIARLLRKNVHSTVDQAFCEEQYATHRADHLLLSRYVVL